jgi:outer membrane protein insertion porin family
MVKLKSGLKIIIILGLLLGSVSTGVAKPRLQPTVYIVNKVFLEGNTKFSTKELKKQLNLKEKRLTISTTFTNRLVELDKIMLETIYIRNGYLDCKVEPSLNIDQAENEVDIVFKITEGRQYYLKKIEISGVHSLSQSQLFRMLDHPVDQPYNPVQIRSGIQKIRSSYANQGKPLAVVKDSLVVGTDISLYINIQENASMRIGNIVIRNNSLVKDEIVRREMLLKPGELYSQEKLDLSKKHIFETGLFSSVSIVIKDVDLSSQRLNLLVDVRELKMRHIGLNFGLGQDRGISSGSDPYTSIELGGEWLHRNMFRRGSRLSLNLDTYWNLTNILLRPKTEAEISYIEPWLWGFRSSTLFRLFLNNQQEKIQQDQIQEITNFGAEVALIYQPDERFYLRSGIEIKGIRYQEDLGFSDSTQVDDIEQARERALTLVVRRDLRNNFLYPSKGTLFSFTGKVVGTILGGNQSYYKFETSLSHYFKIVGPIVFASRLKFGFMDSFYAADPTPRYEKFYMGGETSLRGWAYREVPLSGDGRTIGGDVKLLTSVELRLPLFWIIGGELFVDGGNLTSAIQSVLDTPYRWNAGFGLTIATPLGPIRVDLARKLNPIYTDEREKPWQIQFAIPYAF